MQIIFNMKISHLQYLQFVSSRVLVIRGSCEYSQIRKTVLSDIYKVSQSTGCALVLETLHEIRNRAANVNRSVFTTWPLFVHHQTLNFQKVNPGLLKLLIFSPLNLTFLELLGTPLSVTLLHLRGTPLFQFSVSQVNEDAPNKNQPFFCFQIRFVE